MKLYRLLSAVVAALLVAGVAAAVAVSGDRAPSSAVGEGRLDIQGTALVGHAGHERTVHKTRDLVTGDNVTIASGSGRLFLSPGGYVELRRGTRIMVDHGPDLMSGSLLAVADGPAVVVESLGTLVRATAGATRLTVNLGLQVDVLAGAADITSAGRRLDVAALRSAHVPAVGLVPGQPVPLVVTADDSWDQRYLAAVIDSEAALENLARGFSGQVGVDQAQTLASYQALLPGLGGNGDFDQSSIDGGRAPGETLLAAAIAMLGRRGDSFHVRFADALAFRGQGATWALVAMDELVPSLPALANMVSSAVGQPPQQAAPVLAGSQVATGSPPPIRSTTSATPAPRPNALRPSATPPTPPTPARTTVPAAGPAPSAPLDGLLAPVLDPVLSLLNGLLSPVLGSPTPPPGRP